VNPIPLKKAWLIAAMGSMSTLALAQAGATNSPAPEFTVPPAISAPPVLDTAPQHNVASPPATLPAAPPTGLPMDGLQQRELAGCEAKPVADREVCRDRINAQFNSGRPVTAIKPANDCTALTGAARADCILRGGTAE
jgi:hypothetical protein